MPEQNAAEYRNHGGVVERVNHDDVEMSAESRGDRVAGRRRAHGAQQQHVLDVYGDQFFAVVPREFVQILPQEFDGRLRAVVFPLWHAHVVDKYHALCADRRAVQAASSFVQFAHDYVLRDVGRSLRGEVDERRLVSVSVEFCENIILKHRETRRLPTNDNN